MKKVFVSLEGVLIDNNGQTRPGSHSFVHSLMGNGAQVFIITTHGMEYARRLWEKVALPQVTGFMPKNTLLRNDIDFVVDTDPSFMKSYMGVCIQEWNSQSEGSKDDETLYKILPKLLDYLKS